MGGCQTQEQKVEKLIKLLQDEDAEGFVRVIEAGH